MTEKPVPHSRTSQEARNAPARKTSKLDDPAVRRAFLKVLAQTGRPAEAAMAVGMTYITIEAYAKAYPLFASEYQEARAIYRDMVVNRAVEQRAIHGWLEPVFFKGQEVGQIRRYSDRLLELWAKKFDPEYSNATLTVQNPDGSALQAAGQITVNQLVLATGVNENTDDESLAALERLFGSMVNSPPDLSLEEVPELTVARNVTPGGPALLPHERSPLLLEAQAEIAEEEIAMAVAFEGEPLFSVHEIDAKRKADEDKYSQRGKDGYGGGFFNPRDAEDDDEHD